MGVHTYHDWFGSPEPCPALYISLRRPEDRQPCLSDIIAAVDTGAPLTAIPLGYKDIASLVPRGWVHVRWRGYDEPRVPTYLAYVAAEECVPRLVEIFFDRYLINYALIGRNLMKHWHVTLNGLEQTMEIEEQDPQSL